MQPSMHWTRMFHIQQMEANKRFTERGMGKEVTRTQHNVTQPRKRTITVIFRNTDKTRG